MFKLTITPRFGDVDGLRHINNTVIAIWFEKARNPYFRFFNPNLDLTPGKWNLIMAHTDFDFFGEMCYENDVEIRTSVCKIGNTSFTLLHQAWQNGELKVQGKSVTVHYDFANKKTVAIPENIKKQLAEHLITEDDN
jgi:acyl-CoA thioester hydrolase